METYNMHIPDSLDYLIPPIKRAIVSKANDLDKGRHMISRHVNQETNIPSSKIDIFEPNCEKSPRSKASDKDKPVVKITVIAKNPQPPGISKRRRSSAKRLQSSSSHQDNTSGKNLYVVISGKNTEKIFEVKASASAKDVFVSKYNEEIISVDQLSDCKRIIDSLNMDKKKKRRSDEVKFESNELVYNLGTVDGPMRGCYCTDDKDGGKSGDKSRFRITGRLGLTHDDEYVLKCAATVDDVPIQTSQLESSIDTPFPENFGGKPIKFSINNEPSMRQETQATQVHAKPNLMSHQNKQTQNRDEFLKPSKDQNVQCDGVCNSTYTCGDIGIVDEQDNPLVVISVFPKQGKHEIKVVEYPLKDAINNAQRQVNDPALTKHNIKPLNYTPRNRQKSPPPVSRSPSPSSKLPPPSKAAAATPKSASPRKADPSPFRSKLTVNNNNKNVLQRDHPSKKNLKQNKFESSKPTPNKKPKSKALSTTGTNTDHQQTKKALIDDYLKRVAPPPTCKSKSDMKKGAPSNNYSNKPDVKQMATSNNYNVRPDMKQMSPSNNYSNVPDNGTRTLSVGSGKQSKVALKINGENEYYDIVFAQNKNTTDLLVRKTVKDVSCQADSAPGRGIQDNFNLRDASDQMSESRRPKSTRIIHAQRPTEDVPKMIYTSRTPNISSIYLRDSIEMHSLEDKSINTVRTPFKLIENSSSMDNPFVTDFWAPVKHRVNQALAATPGKLNKHESKSDTYTSKYSQDVQQNREHVRRRRPNKCLDFDYQFKNNWVYKKPTVQFKSSNIDFLSNNENKSKFDPRFAVAPYGFDLFIPCKKGDKNKISQKIGAETYGFELSYEDPNDKINMKIEADPDFLERFTSPNTPPYVNYDFNTTTRNQYSHYEYKPDRSVLNEVIGMQLFGADYKKPIMKLDKIVFATEQTSTFELTKPKKTDVRNATTEYRPPCNEQYTLFHQTLDNCKLFQPQEPSRSKHTPITLTRKQYDRVRKVIHKTTYQSYYVNHRRKRPIHKSSTVSLVNIKRRGINIRYLLYDRETQTEHIEMFPKHSYVRQVYTVFQETHKQRKMKLTSKRTTHKKSKAHLAKRKVLSSTELFYTNPDFSRKSCSSTYFGCKKTEELSPSMCSIKRKAFSIHTLFKGRKKSITPNLGTSAFSIYSKTTNFGDKNHQVESLKPRKPFLRRLMSCLVMRSTRVSGPKPEPEVVDVITVNSSIDSYHIDTSFEAMGMSSSLYDTSASFYSNHTIDVDKTKRGFLNSVRGFLTNSCNRKS